jgi:hypothetical protein
MTNSPIDEYFGNEMDYIKRGLSQINLIMECKEKTIIQLTQENNSLKLFTLKLQEIIKQLQKQIEESLPTISIKDIEQENDQAILKDFLSSL